MGPSPVVKSDRGAVPVFRPARFPGPLPEPAVRLSPQRALRRSPGGSDRSPGTATFGSSVPVVPPEEGGLRIVGIHRRNLLIFHRRPLLTYWTRRVGRRRGIRARTLFRRPPTEPG